jgi:tetratricopeptide (TPR) repeat protein
MRFGNRWILLLPFVCFGITAWLFIRAENEVRIMFERGQERWRSGEYEEALDLFVQLTEKYPKSGYVPDALWEIATVNYFNRYEISSALHFFDRLTKEYPESDYASEAHLKMAEIYDRELNEIERARRHWERALLTGLEEAKSWEIRFKIADCFFKTEQFEEAAERFRSIAEIAADKHIAERALLRLGTIHQLAKEYEEAIGFQTQVLESTDCGDCRLQAQLGLIESYEHLDRLFDAIEIAERIAPEDYPAEVREELLNRLNEKRQYYEPKQWPRR